MRGRRSVSAQRRLVTFSTRIIFVESENKKTAPGKSRAKCGKNMQKTEKRYCLKKQMYETKTNNWHKYFSKTFDSHGNYPNFFISSDKRTLKLANYFADLFDEIATTPAFFHIRKKRSVHTSFMNSSDRSWWSKTQKPSKNILKSFWYSLISR